jgi:hypothetical protein
MIFATLTFVALALLPRVMPGSESSSCITERTTPKTAFLAPIKMSDASDDATDEKNDKEDDPEQIRLWDSVLLG